MIIELLVDIFFSLIDLILSLIPTINIGGNLVGYLNTILDLNVAVSCILITIAIDNASFFMKIINFIVRKIPGVN